MRDSSGLYINPGERKERDREKDGEGREREETERNKEEEGVDKAVVREGR